MAYIKYVPIITGLCFLSLVLSCTKKSERYRNANRQDQFIGTYRVINTSAQFEFTIEDADSSDVNGNPFIIVKNFGNLFNFKYRIARLYKPENSISFPSFDTGDPVIDKHGNRWTFSIVGNPNVPDNCFLHEDTLRVYFQLRNNLWYVDDDTIGIDKFYLQTAVKIK